MGKCCDCENWEDGCCTVKYDGQTTDSEHDCDEVMISKDINPDNENVMFYAKCAKKMGLIDIE